MSPLGYDEPVPRSLADDRPAGRRPRSLPLAMAALALLALVGSGCTTVRITGTTRSSVEQRLITRALERAAARLDTRPLQGRVVRLELYALTGDQSFAREFFRARLEARGIHVARGADGDVTLQVFAAAVAVDTAETLLGLPEMQAPVVSVPIPEIAIF